MKRSKMTELLRLAERLAVYGISADETAELLRIERTLHRWAEAQCNGDIQRDDEGTPWTSNTKTGALLCKAVDREAGALRRLAAIMAVKTGVVAYHQTDPRGCALWIVPADRIPAYNLPKDPEAVAEKLSGYIARLGKTPGEAEVLGNWRRGRIGDCMLLAACQRLAMLLDGIETHYTTGVAVCI